jgi:hypothetical protein
VKSSSLQRYEYNIIRAYEKMQSAENERKLDS